MGPVAYTYTAKNTKKNRGFSLLNHAQEKKKTPKNLHPRSKKSVSQVGKFGILSGFISKDAGWMC